MINKINESVSYIKNQTDLTPKVGIILGSGLGQFGETIENATSINYSDIPHFNSTAVAGHKGRLIIGKIGETNCAIFQGRVHSYEGYDLSEVVYAVRILKFLGAESVLRFLNFICPFLIEILCLSPIQRELSLKNK